MCNCAYKEIQRGHTVSLVPQAIKALLRILFKSLNCLKSGTISKSFDFQNFGIKIVSNNFEIKFRRAKTAENIRQFRVCIGK